MTVRSVRFPRKFTADNSCVQKKIRGVTNYIMHDLKQNHTPDCASVDLPQIREAGTVKLSRQQAYSKLRVCLTAPLLD